MRRRDFLINFGLGTLAVTLFKRYPVYADQTVSKPNFILLLSDDQGWNGQSVQMNPKLAGPKNNLCKTPNLEIFAKNGMRFSRAYAPAAVCSPTRYSIQTGKTPARVRMTKAGPAMTAADNYKLVPPQHVRRIDDKEVTMAQLLKKAGYATAHYGKWHLGSGGPGRFGYDEHDGDTDNRHADDFGGDNPVDIFGMGSRAGDFAEKNSKLGKPFFMQLSYYALHCPEQARKETQQRVRLRASQQRSSRNARSILTAAITEDLDDGVGQLIKRIDSLGIADNTYIIYMSDNGGGGLENYPLRGGKGSLWEGGIRVPFIIRGPGIKAGSICDVPVSGFDLLPSFCELAGISQMVPEDIDGGSFVELLAGKDDAKVQRPREELIFHFPHYQSKTDGPHSAIIQGRYKLMYFYETGKSSLFDLDEDISERNDIAKEKSELTAELEKKLKSYLSEVKAQLPVVNSLYDPNKPSSEQSDRRRASRPGGRDRRRSR